MQACIELFPMASRRLRETPRHKLRLQSCYLSAEIRASLHFVCLRTDDAMLNDAHFNYILRGTTYPVCVKERNCVSNV